MSAPIIVEVLATNTTIYVEWDSNVGFFGVKYLQDVVAFTINYDNKCTITGLTPNTRYKITVTRIILDPSSFFDSEPVDVTTRPDAPTGLTATSNQNKTVSLSWTAPNGTITNYVVYYGNINLSTNSNATGTTVSGLTNGQPYSFMVAAQTASGIGPMSAQASATPSTVPDAPTNLKSVPGVFQVKLSWEAPYTGGSQITGYLVSINDGPSVPTTQLSMTMSGLTPGKTDTFKVRAVNVSGPSVHSMITETSISPLCGIKGFVPDPPRVWTRYNGNDCPNCASNYGYEACANAAPPYSTYELDQRRKAEILKYKTNGAQMSKAQQYSMASRNALTRKKSWATQTQTYTNPNVDNLPETQIPIDGVLRTVSLQCSNQPAIRCSLTSGSDVPGPVIQLCFNPQIPLYNYKMQVTYPSGGTKWPMNSKIIK
jgi:hypothetical protein